MPLYSQYLEIFYILALIFNISIVNGPIGLCFGHDAPMDPYYHIFIANDPIIEFRGPSGPQMTLSPPPPLQMCIYLQF